MIQLTSAVDVRLMFHDEPVTARPLQCLQVGVRGGEGKVDISMLTSFEVRCRAAFARRPADWPPADHLYIELPSP
jgi:hypothetical protein